MARVSLLPAKTRPGSWWWMVSVGAMALIFAIAVLAALWLLARPLGILILGLAIAASLAPIVAWLERRLPRILAIIIVYLIVVLIIAGIVWLVFPPLIDQAVDASERIPELIAWGQEMLDRWDGWSGLSPMELVAGQLGNIGAVLVSLPVVIVSALFDVVLILFISLYALIVVPNVRQFILSLLPQRQAERTEEVLQEMVGAMGGYVRGVLISGAIIATLTYVGLLIIGLEYPLVLGVMAGMFEIVPVLGPLIAGIIVVSIAFLDSTTTGITTLIFFLVLQQIESNIVFPNVMRTQTEISPLLSILALFAGHAVGGLLGALVAVPLAAALRVFVMQVVAPAIRRWTGAVDAKVLAVHMEDDNG